MLEFAYEVVIPAWNAGEFIGETLASLNNQTVPPRGITVVDDGSDDQTGEIATERGARVLRRHRNGVVAARNAGLAVVTAPYVAFVDADDIWDPTFAEMVGYAWMNQAPDVGAIGTLVAPFGDGDLTAWEGPPSTGRLRSIPLTEVWARNTFTASAIIFRAAALQQIGGWREGMTPTDDYDVTLRLAGSGWKLYVLEERLALYRVRNGSWSSNIAASMDSEQRALRDFVDLVAVTDNRWTRLLSPRLNQLWWRSMARAAQYGQPISPPLPFPDGSDPSAGMRATRVLLTVAPLGGLASAYWRRHTRVRSVASRKSFPGRQPRC